MRSKRKKVKTIFVVKSLRKKGLKCNRQMQIINGLKNRKDDTNNKRVFFYSASFELKVQRKY